MLGYVDQLYTYLYKDVFQENAFWFMTIVGYLLIAISFYGFNSILLCFDITNSPSWIQKYKVQADKNNPIDQGKLNTALWVVFRNVFLYNAVVSPVLVLTQLYLDTPYKPEERPYWFRMAVDIVAFALIQEAVFYYSHRLLHHPKLYKYIHKQHHEWTAPIGLIALYAHPIEYLTSNLFTVYAGPLLLRSHIMTTWLWLVIAMFTTITHHSGYHLPLLPNPELHDFHHKRFNYCFGTFGWLDALHGTDSAFRKGVESKRSRVLTSLTPLTVTYPDR